MDIGLSDVGLTDIETMGIESLLSRQNRAITDDLEQVWYLMDLIWDDYNCNNKKLNWEHIGRFYSDPVWLLNGLFIEQDKVSMGHRHVISDWVVNKGFSNVVDYGGGFGTLARLVASKNAEIIIDIYEPHPSDFGTRRASQFNNINMLDKLSCNYDVLISTDVLEHVPDPLRDFSKMIDSVREGGYLIIANCFYPVIKCHLPQAFHFRYTFNIFARLLGLEVRGMIEGSHATIYKKNESKKVNWKTLRRIEHISRVSFPLIEPLISLLRTVKRLLVK